MTDSELFLIGIAVIFAIKLAITISLEWQYPDENFNLDAFEDY